MAADITVPAVGESVTEGTVARWLKKDGDTVRADEPVFELETEKATSEVPAPAAGVLRIIVPEGRSVPVGAVVGRVEEAAGRAAPPASAGRPAPAARAPKVERSVTPPTVQPEVPPAERAGTSSPPAEPTPVVSPAARKLIAEADIAPAEIRGTGRAGRIMKEDVLTHLAREPAPTHEPDGTGVRPPPASSAAGSSESTGPRAPARERRERMSAIRLRIAERLVASRQTTATLTTFNEADLSAVLALRERYKDRFKERHGTGLGFMSFFVKACVDALRAYPVLNARIDGPDVVYQDSFHIGVAVSTERGLMVPVLRDADRLRFAEIERRIAELARKARDGKISVTDLQGGTFTITNGGVFGSLLSTPILNAPQSAILGMHTIQRRPVAVGEQVVIRPMMYLALSYDHRLIDGRDAVLFLVRVKECVENPERLLLEV